MKSFKITWLFLFLYPHPVYPEVNVSVSSPDGKLKVEISSVLNNKQMLNYSVSFRGEPIVVPSGIGFKTVDGTNIGENLEITSVKRSKVGKKWIPVCGEKTPVKDIYNQAQLRFKDSDGNDNLEMTFRAYNEGIAFCYSFLRNQSDDSLYISDELTEFRFTGDFPAWVAIRAQAQYQKISLSKINEAAERPLVIEADNSRYFAIGEARLVDFPRMKFISAMGKDNTLRTDLTGEARIRLPYTSPWRFIMVGESPGELLENNYFILNLNDPCVLNDVSWIRPGKVIREVTLTTQGGKACVDFATANGIEYVEFDAGWYGPENNDASDATDVHVDPARSPGPLDLHGVIRYGKSKNIGIILYVNRRALERQLDEILPLYKSWGINGVKYGFVQVGSQKWTTWLHNAVKRAAENQLMVDIHDEYRPTGFSRTFPNLVTQEGIRGDEESPTNAHTLITLFTRMIAGAGDNTNCYYAPRVSEKMGGHVSQLAKRIMLYSPWQFIYWYDRPVGSPGRTGGAGNSDGIIKNDPELKFYNSIPATWDETRVLEGKIAGFATIARRSGTDWYIGSLTANNQKELVLNLNFLDPKSVYEATVYSHDSEAASATMVKIEKLEVTPQLVLKFSIAPNSGLAIYLKKSLLVR